MTAILPAVRSQRLLFGDAGNGAGDDGDAVLPIARPTSRRTVSAADRKRRQDRKRRMAALQKCLFEIKARAAKRSRRKKPESERKRPYKPIENPLFSMLADDVERLHPDLHKEMQRLIYEERAPLVQARWNDKRRKKRNNYHVDPLVLDAFDVHAAGIDLHIKEKFE